MAAQMKERDALVEELALSNQAQMERNETLTVQNEDLRGEFNEVVSVLHRRSSSRFTHSHFLVSVIDSIPHFPVWSSRHKVFFFQ